jgi:uncharacterized protein (TIGR02118 family)
MWIISLSNKKMVMIKVSVLYPAGENKHFDMDYYSQQHVPMVKRLLGEACKQAAIEQGIAGAAPEIRPVYLAMGHLYFDTAEDFQHAFTPHADTIRGDIPNFTDTVPLVQISEVIM